MLKYIHYALAILCGLVWLSFRSKGLRIVGVATLTGAFLGLSDMEGTIVYVAFSILTIAIAYGVLSFLEERGFAVKRFKIIALILASSTVLYLTPIAGLVAFTIFVFVVNVWIYAYYKTGLVGFLPITLGTFLGYLSGFMGWGEMGYVVDWSLSLFGVLVLRFQNIF